LKPKLPKIVRLILAPFLFYLAFLGFILMKVGEIKSEREEEKIKWLN
jgi:hypothetical protein